MSDHAASSLLDPTRLPAHFASEQELDDFLSMPSAALVVTNIVFAAGHKFGASGNPGW